MDPIHANSAVLIHLLSLASFASFQTNLTKLKRVNETLVLLHLPIWRHLY